MADENKKVITELTEENKRDLDIFCKKYLEIGRSCTPVDHQKAEEIITKFYRRINLEKPMFLFAPSPYSCILLGQLLRVLPEIIDEFFEEDEKSSKKEKQSKKEKRVSASN